MSVNQLVDPDSLTADQISQQKFAVPCSSTTLEYLRLVSKFTLDLEDSIPIMQDQQSFSVTDDNTIKQIRKRWFDNHVFDSSQIKHPQDQYVLLYGIQQPKYKPEFPLYDYLTIAEVKKMIGVPKLDRNILIRVYYQWDCPYEKDQAAISYEEYEKKNFNYIQTPFKVLTEDPQKSCYFYVKTKLVTPIKGLKIEINEILLKGSQQLTYDPNDSYEISIKRDCLSVQTLVKIQGELEKKNLKLKKNQDQIKFTQLDDLKIRQICPPGEVIYLRLNKPETATFLDKQKTQNDPFINIICYQKPSSKGTKNKKNQKKDVIIKKIIKRKYSQIKKIKVGTLLREQRIQDALFTSVNYKDLTVRPFAYFNQFQKLVYQSKQKELQFITVPQNLLYYKEIISLEQKGLNKSMKDVVQHLMTNQKNVTFTEAHRKQCEKIREKRMVNIEQDLKNQQFLDPIILYTSPYIYTKLNAYLRESSVSLINTQNLSKDCWYYPFCEKLIKSLLKLPNHQGIVWRGSVKFDYGYKQGQIIEWNSFISTSRSKQTAIKFLAQGAAPLYLFQIENFSGKEIDKFSFYSNQSEVLVLPYTKFKVTKAQKIKLTFNNKTFEVNYVKLVEIPIPKRIPGHIVVWIDSNIDENSKTFNKIVKINKFEDFDLIQLVNNEHFQLWLSEFKHILSLPNVKVHFISNMNRPPIFKQEGVQTLQIIRSFNQTAAVVFYIGNVDKTRQILKNAKKDADNNLEVVASPKELNRIFAQKFNQQ